MSKRKAIDVSGWPVMSANCATCPFGKNGNPSFARTILSRLGLQLRQICHHPRTKSKRETHLCRGAYDEQFRIFSQRFECFAGNERSSNAQGD